MLEAEADQGAAAAVMGGRLDGLLPVEARDLVFEVDRERLIDVDRLRLDAASLTVVMGPNGAGKSLLLRLLHGIIAPTSGTVEWAGAPLTDAARLRQAMVFQKPVLLRRSVAANLDFVLNLRRGASAARRAELLEQVGLEDKASQPARLLSGGEQQRLALARALATKPDVLFLDEPTASLDPASVLMIEEIVRSVQDRNTKVIFVTHDVGQARRLADEVVFIHRGRVLEQAKAAVFFAAPASYEAAEYLAGRIVV
jgi:tungstate transport system ATP-binding protein